MYILKKELYYKMSSFSKIIIYGAGNYAYVVYTVLKSAGFKEKISSFVVTKMEERKHIDEIPILCVDELELIFEEGSVVVIAVSEEHEEEIIRTLQSFPYINPVKFTDYIIQNDIFYERLREKTNKQFIESIFEEYAWSSVSSICELEKKIDSSIAQRDKKDIDKDTIVYISGDLKPRTAKIINALVKRQYQVVVLEYGFLNELIRSEIISYKVDFFQCKDIIEVFYRALQYKPLVYFFEPEWGDCVGSEIMIRHKELYGKIVFAPYDIMNDGYVQISEKDKLKERYCLENADGIVWRWFSKEFLEKKKGFVYKGKAIQFLDYCMGFEVKKNNKSDNKLKLCFVQGAVYELLNEEAHNENNEYSETASLSTILKKIGNVSDCIFHIFIGNSREEERIKLDKLEKEYSNFKVFYGMKYEKMISAIAEYDYGCSFMTGGKDIPEQESIDNVYYGSTYMNSVANRFFDYLDANIPIIGTLPKKQCEFFERFGLIAKMDISDLDIDYLKENKMFYKENILKAKNELLIDNQIQRLIDLFHEV